MATSSPTVERPHQHDAEKVNLEYEETLASFSYILLKPGIGLQLLAVIIKIAIVVW